MKFDEDAHVLICAPQVWGPIEDQIAGSIGDTCDDCKQGIWMAPTGQRMRAQGAYALCMHCGLRSMQENPGEVGPPTEDQKRELEDHWLRGAL